MRQEILTKVHQSLNQGTRRTTYSDLASKTDRDNPSETRTHMPHKILIADDEPHLRRLVRTTLDFFGCEFLEAANGRDALRLAEEHRPDLVILDWMMPEMSGDRVASRLRDIPELSGVPVIMLTARSSASPSCEAQQQIFDAYLSKPFSPLQLMEVVQDLTSRIR